MAIHIKGPDPSGNCCDCQPAPCDPCTSLCESDVDDLVWTGSGDCSGSTAAGGTLTFATSSGASCVFDTCLGGVASDYDIEFDMDYTITTNGGPFPIGGAGFIEITQQDNCSGAFTAVYLDTVTATFSDFGCVTKTVTGATQTLTITASQNTCIKVAVGNAAFPPSGCTCSATVTITPGTPP